MDLPKLLDVATEFRQGIEAIPAQLLPIGLQGFPRGACGDASLLLGARLTDLGIEGFKYVCGERVSKSNNTRTSHAWLQSGTCVIDITGDQFPDAPAPVVVADPSEWHANFTLDGAQPADFRLWSGYGADLLRPTYARIQKSLTNSGAENCRDA